MARPLVTVVIPTRDRSDLITGAVDSVLAQEYPEIELIIVDDGSTDETPSVLAELQRIHPIRVLRHEPPRGAAASRNAGAAVARGELLLFEDDDCRGEPDRVGKLVEALERRPDAAYAYCRSVQIDGQGGTTVKGGEGPWAVGTPVTLIRSEVFSRVGGFDEALPRLQDFDLWTRVLARHTAVEVPQVLVRTLRAGEGISESTERLVEAARHMARKYDDADYPARHLARMHRFLGGALVLRGQRGEALRHFRTALALQPLGLRSWLAFLAGLAGARGYRLAVELTRGGRPVESPAPDAGAP